MVCCKGEGTVSVKRAACLMVASIIIAVVKAQVLSKKIEAWTSESPLMRQSHFCVGWDGFECSSPRKTGFLQFYVDVFTYYGILIKSIFTLYVNHSVKSCQFLSKFIKKSRIQRSLLKRDAVPADFFPRKSQKSPIYVENDSPPGPKQFDSWF